MDPVELSNRLRFLGLYTGTDSDGAKFDATIALTYDLPKMEKLRDWRQAVLARYGNQQVVFLLDMPIDEQYRLIDGLRELMSKENALQSHHETNM